MAELSRRGFLKLFSLAAVAFAVTTPTAEQLFKTAHLPENEEEFGEISLEDLVIAMKEAYPPDFFAKTLFTQSPYLSYLKKGRL
jgi:hypothetical protein